MSSTGQGAVADAPRLTCAGELGEWGRVGVGEGQKRNASECDSVCATKSAVAITTIIYDAMIQW